jgi:hypothetical protein
MVNGRPFMAFGTVMPHYLRNKQTNRHHRFFSEVHQVTQCRVR